MFDFEQSQVDTTVQANAEASPRAKCQFVHLFCRCRQLGVYTMGAVGHKARKSCPIDPQKRVSNIANSNILKMIQKYFEQVQDYINKLSECAVQNS